jgi:hypothetical protein
VSAYIVEDKVINQIVTYVVYARDLGWLRQEFAEAIAPSVSGNFGPEIGRALFDMNVAAVEVRYGKGQAKEFRALDYRFTPESASELRVYHAIRELLYQCDEGDIAETNRLYGLLGDLKAVVADSIIERVTEPSRGWSGAKGPGHEGDAYVAALLDELRNSLEARCESCCRGIEHDDSRCGAPTARRLLAGAGKVTP